MDKKEFQTSFIPKKHAESRSAVTRMKRPMTVYSWGATLIFILVLVATAGSYLYERFLVNQNNDRKLMIQEEISSFDAEQTRTLTVIKTRIDSGEDLLRKHLSASSFLSELQAVTVESIFFNNFEFETVLGQDISVTAGGIAPSYMALAFQSNTLREAGFIKNISFSDLNLNEQGDVEFSFEATVDTGIALYSNLIEPEPVSPSAPPEQSEADESEEIADQE